MRDFVRPVAAALGVVVALSVASTGGVFAQAKQQQMAPPQKQAPAQAAPPQADQPQPVKQMALTDKQVESVLAAQKDMDAITDKIPDNAKPDPDLFLAAAARLNAPIERAVVVGDSIWDMLAAARCRALGVGLLCGGYGASELQQATAFRVYEDPADLLVHIDELGGRR